MGESFHGKLLVITRWFLWLWTSPWMCQLWLVYWFETKTLRLVTFHDIQKMPRWYIFIFMYLGELWVGLNIDRVPPNLCSRIEMASHQMFCSSFLDIPKCILSSWWYIPHNVSIHALQWHSHIVGYIIYHYLEMYFGPTQLSNNTGS